MWLSNWPYPHFIYVVFYFICRFFLLALPARRSDVLSMFIRSTHEEKKYKESRKLDVIEILKKRNNCCSLKLTVAKWQPPRECEWKGCVFFLTENEGNFSRSQCKRHWEEVMVTYNYTHVAFCIHSLNFKCCLHLFLFYKNLACNVQVHSIKHCTQ